MYLLHTNLNLGNCALSEQTLMIWVRYMIGLDHLELKNFYSLVVTEKMTFYGISSWPNLSKEPMYNHGNSVILSFSSDDPCSHLFFEVLHGETDGN